MKAKLNALNELESQDFQSQLSRVLLRLQVMFHPRIKTDFVFMSLFTKKKKKKLNSS